MNGWALLGTLAWCAVCGSALWRAEVLLRAYWAQGGPTEPSVDTVIDIPDDLEAFALGESELHAQEAIREVVRSRYADLKDWNRVRHAIGIGEIDD